MDDIYREQIIDHYKNPRNYGELEGADIRVKEANASCGDLFELTLRFSSGQALGKRQVESVRFSGMGCAISTAAMSVFTEKIKEMKNVEKIEKIKEEDMLGMLGIKVSPTRMKCVMLPLRVFRKALVLKNNK